MFCAPVGRVLVESVEKRERRDNLELQDLPEEEDDLEMTDLKETLYDAHSQTYTHTHTDIVTQINDFNEWGIFSVTSSFAIDSDDISISELCFCRHHQGPVGFPGDPGPPGEVGPRVSILFLSIPYLYTIFCSLDRSYVVCGCMAAFSS